MNDVDLPRVDVLKRHPIRRGERGKAKKIFDHHQNPRGIIKFEEHVSPRLGSPIAKVEITTFRPFSPF
jgi:hypothetical protein